MDTKSLPLMGRLPAFSSRTTLEGWQLTAARVVWALVTLLIFSLFVLGVPSDYSQQLKSASTEFSAALGQLGLEPVFLAVYRTAMNLLLAILFLTAGIFVFVRKSDDWMVMLTSLACSGFVVLFLPTLVRLMDAHPEFTLPVAFSRAFGLGSSLIVFYYLFINVFNFIYYSDALLIVKKAMIGPQLFFCDFIQNVFAGMPERGVPKIMPKRNGFR